MTSNFPGFSPQALVFFAELAENNNKAWFEAHRADYETLLLEPLQELVAELAAPLLAIDPALQVLPPSRCIARIHRDIRFSRDKSPYKSHLWLSFKRPSPDWKEHPCFFFEIAADRYRYGMGFYSAPKATMDALRRTIETAPEKFRRLVAPIKKSGRFVPAGELYKRPVNPALPADLQPWHGRKNLYLISTRTPDERLFSPGILQELREGYGELAALYRVLWGLG